LPEATAPTTATSSPLATEIERPLSTGGPAADQERSTSRSEATSASSCVGGCCKTSGRWSDRAIRRREILKDCIMTKDSGKTPRGRRSVMKMDMALKTSAGSMVPPRSASMTKVTMEASGGTERPREALAISNVR